jgi:hypothetical protein
MHETRDGSVGGCLYGNGTVTGSGNFNPKAINNNGDNIVANANNTATSQIHVLLRTQADERSQYW